MYESEHTWRTFISLTYTAISAGEEIVMKVNVDKIDKMDKIHIEFLFDLISMLVLQVL